MRAIKIYPALALATAMWSSTALASYTSCPRASVQAAVNAAKDGDVVHVLAGTCTWNASVTVVNKTITLVGAGSQGGSAGTNIKYGGTGHTLLSIQAGSKTGKMDVSGFHFVGGDPNYWNGTAITFSGPIGWSNLRIHNNNFDGNTQWSIRGSASTYGLVDQNTFKGSAHGIYLDGNGDVDWTTPLVLGTSQFFFIERNTFSWADWYGSTGAVLTDFSNGGRVVFRHNTTKFGFFETHDRARNGFPSADAWEIYSNSFSSPTNKWKGLDISAGTGVIWGNTFTGDWTVPIGGIDYKTADPRTIPPCDGNDPADQNTPGESGWRCQYQIGSQNFGPNAVGYPAYIWSNTLNGQSTGMNVTGGENHVVSGRDYYNNGTTPKPGYVPYTYPHPLSQ